MYFTEEDDLIDIRKDNVFKAVFTKKTPESMGKGDSHSFVSVLSMWGIWRSGIW